jgi:hypothetical protein
VGSKGKIGEARRSAGAAQQFLLDEPGRLKARDHKGLGSIERSGKILSHFEKQLLPALCIFAGLRGNQV